MKIKRGLRVHDALSGLASEQSREELQVEQLRNEIQDLRKKVCTLSFVVVDCSPADFLLFLLMQMGEVELDLRGQVSMCCQTKQVNLVNDKAEEKAELECAVLGTL